jgi:hypothetical protein
MHQMSVRGEVMSVPKMCCCCGDPKAKKRYKVSGARTGRWIDTNYTDKRWCFFPICKRCHEWIAAQRAAERWFVVFLGALILGVLVAVPAAIAGGRTTGALIAAAIAGVFLLLAPLACFLWRSGAAHARRLDPGPPCSPRPVVLTDWLRNKHTFRFSHEGFYQQFRLLNQDNIG